MLIDDDPGTNFYHRIILRNGGWANKIIEAKDGEDTITYLQQPFGADKPRPNLIFLDINMPRMNGWEFLEAYKNLNSAQRAENIVVMLSTSCNPDDFDQADKNSLISDYRSKPLTEEMLEKLLTTYWPSEVSV